MAVSNLIKNSKALFKILKFLNVSVLAIYFSDVKNFSILNKALLFLIKLNKTAVQSVPKLLICF